MYIRPYHQVEVYESVNDLSKNDVQRLLFSSQWVRKGHKGKITCAAFNLTGLLATGSSDGTVRLWDQEAGLQTALLSHGDEILALSFNTEGDRLLTGSCDNTAKIWDVHGKCLHTLTGHGSLEGNRGYVCCVSFDFTTRLCASGSLDGSCKLWRVKTGRCLETLRGHNESGIQADAGRLTVLDASAQVLDLCFSRAGDHLATCSTDCTALVYRVNDDESQAGKPSQGHSGAYSC